MPKHCPYALPGKQTYFVPVLRLVDEGHAQAAITMGRRRGDEAILALDQGVGEGSQGGKRQSRRQRLAAFVMAARGEDV